MAKIIPQTIDEAVKMIKLELIATDTLYTKALKSPEDFVISVHHTWGQWIRNEWCLWGANGSLSVELRESGIKHPDDMSSYLLNKAISELKSKSLTGK